MTLVTMPPFGLTMVEIGKRIRSGLTTSGTMKDTQRQTQRMQPILPQSGPKQLSLAIHSLIVKILVSLPIFLRHEVLLTCVIVCQERYNSWTAMGEF